MRLSISAKPRRCIREHTGFEIKYQGPDTHHRLAPIPHDRLFRVAKAGAFAVPVSPDPPRTFRARCTPARCGTFAEPTRELSKRCCFRTASRCRRRLTEGREVNSATCWLAPGTLPGLSYYRTPARPSSRIWRILISIFFPSRTSTIPPAQDSRAQVSPQRSAAMFDWWERIFDYDRVSEAGSA